MKDEPIRTQEDLVRYLTTKRITSRNPPESILVSTALRKLVSTSPSQGRFIHNGASRNFAFESLGGVWKASIKVKV